MKLPNLNDHANTTLKPLHLILMIGVGLLPFLLALIAKLNGIPMTEGITTGDYDYALVIMFKALVLSAAITIAVLCFLEFAETGRLVKPLLAGPLLAGGCMELMQLGVLFGWIPTTAPLQVYLPMSWVISDGLVVTYLCLLPTIFLITDTIRGRERQRRATQWAIGITTGLVIISLGMLHTLTEQTGLQRAFAEGGGMAHLIAWIPVILFVILGAFILPTYIQWHPSVFGQSMMLACIPLGLAHAVIALSPQTCCGWAIFAANTGKLIGYLLPCVGLVLDYRWTYQSMKASNRRLQDEIFMATQLSESSRNHQKHLQTLFNTLRQPICLLDASRHILQINTLTASLCKLHSPQQAVGKLPEDVFDSSLAAVFAEGINQAMASGDLVRLAEEWMCDPSEIGENPIRWTFRPITDEQGGITGIMAIGSEQPLTAPV